MHLSICVARSNALPRKQFANIVSTYLNNFIWGSYLKWRGAVRVFIAELDQTVEVCGSIRGAA